uniref:Zinc finger protein 287 n=1 Tax=Ceratitis capitata TaxID=7213 RepID=W8BT15_CERCA
MEAEFKNGKVEYSDLKKCGEITTLLTVGKKEFFLNCNYCDFTYLQLNEFIQHVCEVHFNQFLNLEGNSKEFSKTCSTWKHKDSNDKFGNSFVKNEDNHLFINSFESVEIERDIRKFKKGAEESEEGKSHIIDEKDTILELTEISKIDTHRETSEEIDDNNFEDFHELSQETFEEDEEIEFFAAQNDNESEDEKSSSKMFHICNAQLDVLENGRNKALLAQRHAKKKFVIELIEVYRNLPSLWDTNSEVYFDRKLKKQQYEILLQKYKEKYPNATKDKVKGKIQALRANFRREIKLMSASGASTLYYFDAMKFLLNLKHFAVRNSNEAKDEKFTATGSILNDTQSIKLAVLYKKYKCLWDEKEISYRFANRRREALENILEEYNTTCGLSLTKNDLDKEIIKLRKICTNEKRHKIACKRSNKVYKPMCPYYQHLEYLEVDVHPYECNFCDKVIYGICQYKIHLASHDGSLPFKCNVCGNGFKLATNLTVHLRRHVQDYTYSCEFCKKTCATTTELRNHERMHTGEKPFVCDTCGKTLSTYSEFKRHDQRHGNQPTHKCEICSKMFYEKRKLKEHMYSHRNVRDSICDVCNKGFVSVKQLRQHKLIHNEEKKYLCKICGKRFAQYAGLSSHMKTHGTKLTGNSFKNFDR